MRFSHLTGATRSAATNVPTTIAITNATTTSLKVTQRPELNSGRCSSSTSQSSLTLLSSSRLDAGLRYSSGNSFSASCRVMSGGPCCWSSGMYWPTHSS